MSLETVAEDIKDEARARADEIRESGEAQAQEILEEAEREAAAIREETLQDADRKIGQEREQRLSSAKLEAKQTRLEARRDVLQQIRSDVEDRIAALEGDQREELTRKLLEDAASEFDGASDVDVYGRSEDADLLEELVTEYDGFEYASEYDCLGGVVVEGTESRLRVKNTFDSILEDVWEEQLREISERLFDK